MSSTTGRSRYKSSVLLGAMLFAPAAMLVLRGNLSINEALVRFGCALLFAAVGTALVLSSMPGSDRAEGESAPGSASSDGDSSAADQAAAAAAAVGLHGAPVTQPAG
ncbi:MAG: hypothetical protein ABIQ13_05790 [Pedococcus sp.]